MDEKTLVNKICNWLKNQGFIPETEVLLGKKGRKIRVDIYVDRTPQTSLAIEVKSRKEELFDGIGKALYYVIYTGCEVWLAAPEKMCKLLKHLAPLNLPFKVFNTTSFELLSLSPNSMENALKQETYVCPLCGNKIGNITQKNWVRLHFAKYHNISIEELFEAIRTYRLVKDDERLKRTVEYMRSHSEDYEYAEGNEREWCEEDAWFKKRR